MRRQNNLKSNILPKKIQIYPFIDNLHSISQTLITHPPKGYEFIGITNSKKQSLMRFIRFFKPLKIPYHWFLKLIKTTALIDFLYSSKKISEADLVYSINVLYKGDSPWVLEILDNTAHGLAGYNHAIFMKNLKKINADLSKDNCRKIICANKTSFKYIGNLFSQKVRKKTVYIQSPYILPKSIKKIKKYKELNLLFMGSLANPQDFYIKGGLETLTVFERISKDYPCKLTFKCKIPEKLRERIMGNKNIILIEKKISKEEISDLYNSSDIFFLPSHTYMGSVLEAMSFGLPVICLDTFAVEDYVRNNYTGIIVKKSERIKEYKEESYPTNLRTEKFIRELENIDFEVIKRLYDAIEYLIKNPQIRKKIGKNGKEIVKKEYNIEKHNGLLKKVFDEVLINN